LILRLAIVRDSALIVSVIVSASNTFTTSTFAPPLAKIAASACGIEYPRTCLPNAAAATSEVTRVISSTGPVGAIPTRAITAVSGVTAICAPGCSRTSTPLRKAICQGCFGGGGFRRCCRGGHRDEDLLRNHQLHVRAIRQGVFFVGLQEKVVFPNGKTAIRGASIEVLFHSTTSVVPSSGVIVEMRVQSAAESASGISTNTVGAMKVSV